MSGKPIDAEDIAVLLRLQAALPNVGLNGWFDGVRVLARVIEHLTAAQQQPVGMVEAFEEYHKADHRDPAVAPEWEWWQAAWKAALAQQPAAVDRARFRKAPCYLCGYNGAGYFQPETHPCAALYHAAQRQEPKP